MEPEDQKCRPNMHCFNHLNDIRRELLTPIASHQLAFSKLIDRPTYFYTMRMFNFNLAPQINDETMVGV